MVLNREINIFKLVCAVKADGNPDSKLMRSYEPSHQSGMYSMIWCLHWNMKFFIFLPFPSF